MREMSFARSGLRAGRIRGIDVWIHWSLLLWFAYVFYQEWVGQKNGVPLRGWEMTLHVAVWWAAVGFSILVHELGHCYFAFQQGGSADAVVLWPLGGLAHCDAPHLPRNQFFVAAGGPIAELLIIIPAGIWIALSPDLNADAFPRAGQSLLETALGALFWQNVLLLGLNVIPVYPLDGGRMFQAIVWGKIGSFGRATIITVWTSRIAILSTIVVGILLPKEIGGRLSFLGLMLLGWAIFETEKLNLRLRSGEEEDFIFGYDFSRGYTSLERTATRSRPQAKPSFLQRLKLRAHENRQAREAETRRRVDALLEKISREGMASLSRRERKFLERASRRFNKT